MYTIHKTNNRKSINGFRKKLSHLERSHSNGTSSTRSHKSKKQYKFETVKTVLEKLKKM